VIYAIILRWNSFVKRSAWKIEFFAETWSRWALSGCTYCAAICHEWSFPRAVKQKYTWMCDVKSRVSLEDLYRGFPAEFVRYFYATGGLRFSDETEYPEFWLMFRKFFTRNGHVYDCRYDWEQTVRLVPTAPPR
jgi:hypothetical protein